MGTNTNQIATEGNVENNTTYAGNISSSKTNTKCITVNRLLQGLIETSNTPTYNILSGSGYSSSYQLKVYGNCPTTSVTIGAGYLMTTLNDSQIITTTNTTNYGAYPFSTGTGFLAISANYSTTINATITVTCVQLVNPTGDDGVSPASMDFDNPEDDNESNMSDEYPTVSNTTGNNSRALCATELNDWCQSGNQLEICTNKITIGCTEDCPTYTPCTQDFQPGKTYAVTLTLMFQIYAGKVDGEDTYTTICYEMPSIELTLNSNKTKTISLNIPTRKGFAIDEPPTGELKFRLKMNHMGLGTHGDAGVSAKISATVPRFQFVAYNPGPKCIKYTDLSTVYTLY